MPAKIQQMQLSFIPAEDRLLFQMNTTAREEFRLWFTRRYVKQMWPRLLRALDFHHAAQTPQSLPPQAKASVRAFHHQQQVAKADFNSAYQKPPETRWPLGKTPVLLAQVQIKQGPSQALILCLHPEAGKGLELALDTQLTHSLCKLISEALKHTDWGLNYQLAEAAAPGKRTLDLLRAYLH